jgi:hypothetical protein
MVNTYNLHTAFFSLLLMIAVLSSYGMQGLYPSSALSTSDSNSAAFICINMDQPTSPTKLPSEVNNNSPDSSAPQGSTTTAYSCNSSVQTIPVEKQYLQQPTESTIIRSAYNATLASQIFVFQEPDPPRLG